MPDSHLVNLKGKRPCNYSDGSLKRAPVTRQRLPGHEGKLPVSMLREVRELENPKAWRCERQCLSQAAVLGGNEWALSKSRGRQELVGPVTSLEGGRILTDAARAVHT